MLKKWGNITIAKKLSIVFGSTLLLFTALALFVIFENSIISKQNNAVNDQLTDVNANVLPHAINFAGLEKAL